MTMCNYELTLAGFTGATDTTDELNIWVRSGLTLEDATAWLKAENLLIDGKPSVIKDICELPQEFPTDYMLPSDELIAAILDKFPVIEAEWVTNFYTCPRCHEQWQDEWDCGCDDECPSCGTRHITPTHSVPAEGITI